MISLYTRGEIDRWRGQIMEAEQKEKLDQLNQSLETLNFYARLMSYGLILLVIMVVFIAFFSKIGIY
jgi:hypothetical protein